MATLSQNEVTTEKESIYFMPLPLVYARQVSERMLQDRVLTWIVLNPTPLEALQLVKCT